MKQDMEKLTYALAGSPNIGRWVRHIIQASDLFAASVNTPVCEFALDIAAIIDRESGGQNVYGDGGHGRGLMQIDDRYWGLWLAANQGGMLPESNVRKGSAIYANNLHMFEDIADPVDRRRCAMAAYNCGHERVIQALSNGLGIDGATTGKNYSADCLRRRQPWADRMAKFAG